MGKSFVWRILENPIAYRISQLVLAPGAVTSVVSELKNCLDCSGGGMRHLDVGSGPASLLWNLGIRPIGVDPVHAYSKDFKSKGSEAVTASGAALPFRDDSFDRVWSFGLLHHLSNPMAEETIQEMLRVIRSGGRVVIFDGVIPNSFWRNPFVWVLRKLDRGRYMRKQAALESLLADRRRWSVKRFRYCLWGHEGVLCVYQKPWKNGR